VRVVGLTRGLVSLSGPYVLCSESTARQLLGVPPGETTYVLARCRHPADAPLLAGRLTAEYHDLSAFTAGQFSQRTRMHWLLKTKMGVGAGYLVLLVLLTGCVALWLRFNGQAVAHVRAGSLRGGYPSRWRLAAGAVGQSLGVGLAGAVLGAPLMLAAGSLLQQASVRVLLPWWLAFFGCFVTVAMALLAGLGVALRVPFLRPLKGA
jgi:putative ABC transport system permease protein